MMQAAGAGTSNWLRFCGIRNGELHMKPTFTSASSVRKGLQTHTRQRSDMPKTQPGVRHQSFKGRQQFTPSSAPHALLVSFILQPVGLSLRFGSRSPVRAGPGEEQQQSPASETRTVALRTGTSFWGVTILKLRVSKKDGPLN